MVNPDQRQAPGVYRRRIGDAMVTVINDGYLDMPFELLRGVALDDMRSLMREVFHEGPPRISVNAYVVETGGRTILVDAGGGSTTVFSMGLLPENLSAAGFSAADFDTVVLTHIHPDHSSGLLGASGERLFPRAEIVIHADDKAFWSDAGLRDGHIAAAMPYLNSAAAMLGAYHDQLRPSRAGTIVPGLTLLELPGHTPGTCRLSFGLCRRDTRYLGRYRSCARNSGPAPAGDERMRHRRAAGCREPAMHLRSGRVGTLARRWRPSSYARLCAPCTRRRFLPLSS
jgi:glyoxylase-like metal-dependent hydrolase (beta-lactamase superfamily II)